MRTDPDPIVFGRPVIPRSEDFMPLLAEVFASGQLTNGGALQARLEAALGLRYGACVTLVSSGTMAVMMALRLGNLPLGGAVITTPLSFAASTQAIDWCGLRPVFADVEPETGTLCPEAVERAITDETVAILAVHFQGIACDIDRLSDIARAHGLWLVFDAAQAPDVTRNTQSIAIAGDATAISLHATKLLNTAEGGAVITRDPAQGARLARMRNFGLGNGQAVMPGINGKLSELHAAMGLAVLPLIDDECVARARLRRRYDAALSGLSGARVVAPRQGTSESHLYYTLTLAPGLRYEVLAALRSASIVPRAPFPPLCGPGSLFPDARIITAPATPAHSPVAADLAERYLSLPLHGGIDAAGARRVTETIARALD